MKNMKIGDLFAIGAVLLLAAVCFLAFLPRGGGGDAVAQIYQNGQLLMTVALDRPDQFPVQGDYCNTVTVKDGAIAITDSDCPGQDCIHSGSIRAPRQKPGLPAQCFGDSCDLGSVRCGLRGGVSR